MDLENAGASAPVADVAAPPPVVDAPPAAVVEDKEPSVDETLAQVYRNANRERESNGQFKGKAADLAPAAQVSDQPPVVATETAPPSIQAPQSWSAEVKDKWATLPPDLQAFISKREGEAHSTITRYGEQVKAYEPLGQVLDQYRGSFERSGVTPDVGVQRLLEAERQLEQDPHRGIQYLADFYGVDLAQLAGPQDGSSPEGQLHQTIAQLRSELNEIRSGLSDRQRQDETVKLKSVESQIQEFAKDKTDWAELENDVFRQVVAIKATSPNLPHAEVLKQAYDAAKWANPTARERTLKEQQAAARERTLKEQQAAADKKNAEEAKKRADAARAASTLNVRSTTAGGTAAGSIDDTLTASYRAAQSR